MTAKAGLEWTIHLARRRPRQAAAVVGVVAAGSLAAGYGFRSVVLGVLAAFLLVGAISDYLFPVRYTITPGGIDVRGPLHRRRMAWQQVRRVVRDQHGVKLSPLPAPSRLQAYRGIYLWFADNADDVMAIIAHHTGAEAAGGDDIPPVQHLPGESRDRV